MVSVLYPYLLAEATFKNTFLSIMCDRELFNPRMNLAGTSQCSLLRETKGRRKKAILPPMVSILSPYLLAEGLTLKIHFKALCVTDLFKP